MVPYRIILLFCWILSFQAPFAHAQEELTSPSKPVANQTINETKRGALFKIQHASHTLFLFGTIHVGKPEFYPLERTVSEAVMRASKIALEIDPLNNQAHLQATLKYGLYPPGSNINLPPLLQARVKTRLEKAGLPFSAISHMKPWMVAMVLTLSEFANLGYQSSMAVDLYLANLAKEQNKRIIELETVQDQLSLFGSLNEIDQIRFLEETLSDFEENGSAKKALQIVDNWRSADITGLDALVAELTSDTRFSGKFFREVLLLGRNPNFADGIAKLLVSEKNAFAAIGILHLLGPGSVPALLQQRGYVVERIY